ncbi:SCO5555 family protein [Streptomyces sp. SS8]
MESDGQLPLYDLVAARLKDAHTMVRALQVPDDVRAALVRRLLAVTAAAKHDLGGAVRRLDRLMEDIGAGDGPFPGEEEDRRADRSA